MILHAWQVELGLVWVWPESSPEAWIESAAQQPALCPLVKDLDPGELLPLSCPSPNFSPCYHLSFSTILTSVRCPCSWLSAQIVDEPPAKEAGCTCCPEQVPNDHPAVAPLLPDRILWCAEKVGLTTNQNYIRDFPVAYDILFENISDQVCRLAHLPLILW